MIYAYDYNGETVSVSVERGADGTITARVGDETFTLRASPAANGGLLLDFGDRRLVAHTANAGDDRYVHINGATYALATAESTKARRRSTAGDGDLSAQMPGQVIDVLVDAGDTVAAGQTLVILEAMKMEIRVNAPTDGVVERVLVSKGDVVERGQSLVIVATPSD